MRWNSAWVVAASALLSLPVQAAPKAKGKKKAPAAAAPVKAAPVAPSASKAIEGAVNVGDRPAAPVGDQSGAPAPKGPTRIDFDDRLVEGQTNKSGAVYLYDRKDLQVDSMVKQRSTYREEIARDLLE